MNYNLGILNSRSFSCGTINQIQILADFIKYGFVDSIVHANTRNWYNMSANVVNVSLKCDIGRLVDHVATMFCHHEHVTLVAIEGAVVNAMDVAIKLKESGSADILQVDTSLHEMETRVSGVLKPRSKLTIVLRRALQKH
jgi:hypothetical protein